MQNETWTFKQEAVFRIKVALFDIYLPICTLVVLSTANYLYIVGLQIRIQRSKTSKTNVTEVAVSPKNGLMREKYCKQKNKLNHLLCINLILNTPTTYKNKHTMYILPPKQYINHLILNYIELTVDFQNRLYKVVNLSYKYDLQKSLCGQNGH